VTQKRGLFLTFEGMDGSGKTTQMHRLAGRLRAAGRTVVETVEPGGPPIAQKIRRILLDAAHVELSPATEVLLYFASRAQNVDEWINPALSRGEIVLSDRFTDSSLVYQGVGRGLGADTVTALERIACRGLKPDLTILVDVDAEASLARARARNAAEPHPETRMDDQSLDFHRRVHAAYDALAQAEPERVKVVDGRQDIDAIERDVWQIVSAYV
jgi:dTMP kinase